MAHPRTLQWIGDADSGWLRLLDQTRLPTEVAYRDCHAAEDVQDAIKRLQVRGAPAIGVAAAYGMVLGARDGSAPRRQSGAKPDSSDPSPLREVAAYLRAARPTAVNLAWALDRMLRRASAAAPNRSLPDALLAEAEAIEAEDSATCRAIGVHGAPLIRDGGGVLTHCNTGALAASDHGTALAALVSAHEQGKRFTVYVDETRPLLQGARLTMWELQQRGIDCVLICDGMAGQVMKEGKVQLVLVGADRIAANGDVANKIGTYSLAIQARHHGIPLYVAAPRSTFDLALSDGAKIPIEQRPAEEITHGFGSQTAPAGARVYNPAFDVTPADFIAGIITEVGLIQPVNSASILPRLAVQ
jgi:methylthioribose-1-phosphate isomerase